MSESDDQATKKELKIKDEPIADCSKMSNMHAQCLLYETLSAYNMAAKRSVLYRERHQEEINQQRKDIRQHQQNLQLPTVSNVKDTDKIEQITQATSNTQLSLSSHTQRQRQYYERHKEEINKRKRDSRLKLNISQTIPATAAERSFVYRERHKEEINQRRREMRQRQRKVHQIHTVSNEQNTDEIEQITKATSNNQLCSNSHTLRQRRYYEKHKEEINKRKRESRLKQNISQSIPATPAERSRKYRERNSQEINEHRRYSRLCKKILQRMHTECNIKNTDDIKQITVTTPNDQQSLHLNTDEFDEIIKATLNNQLSSNSQISKQKRYYERHKEEINKRKRERRLKQKISQLGYFVEKEIARNFTSTPQQHNSHFEETQNDRVQTTT